MTPQHLLNCIDLAQPEGVIVVITADATMGGALALGSPSARR